MILGLNKKLMKLFYQGFPWAYWHRASYLTAKKYNFLKEDIIWLRTFEKVFEKVKAWNIWILPMENSYAWAVHENYYNILSWDYIIIDEIYLDINHFLLWNTNDISKIKEVYSHPQALMQTQDYCKEKWIIQHAFSDTAWAAKFVKESSREDIASVSSEFCSKIYWLKIIDKNIEDQNWNTTRFMILISKDIFFKNQKKFQKEKAKKMSIIFKTKDIPAALYKCLWAFATRFINLTKIESLPAKNDKFEYIFWVDLQLNVEKKVIDAALDEVNYFCKDLKILGKY